jgi:hypothetical protein
MGDILSGRQQASNNIATEGYFSKPSEFGIVYDVILNETHPYILNGKATLEDIGSIIYRKYDDTTTTASDLQIAKLYDFNFKHLPTRNEKVQIFLTPIGRFYKRLNSYQTPNVNAVFNEISTFFENSTATNTDATPQSAQQFRDGKQTNMPNTNVNSAKQYDGFGKYFEYTPNIHRLKLYEGDSLIESRFGQSIRFSAYGNVKNIFSPIIILRNFENDISQKLDSTETIDEDINRDGSIIAMTSNQYQLPFIPGKVDKSGTSDMQTKPDSFKDYPSKLIGDQILINSGRIILSAKNAEMLFYSKKNYGFVSDGALSIDNKLGIEASVGGDINILTNDRDVTFYTGNGNISLGDVDREPLVKGKQLKSLLEDLIVAILNQTYLTPSGPTALGPENFNDFIEISDRINDILSKKNSTS